MFVRLFEALEFEIFRALRYGCAGGKKNIFVRLGICMYESTDRHFSD